MTNTTAAEECRKYYLTHTPRKATINICHAMPNWSGCSYCDIYAGPGLECWKQDGPHHCCKCTEERRGVTA